MNRDGFRVHAPTTVVFLCGGFIDASSPVPVTLRDAFSRTIRASALKYKVILAEEAQPLTADAGYKDLFSFESDIAQIVGLILLFAESPGSLAELGAFAALHTVAPSLLAVLDDFYYSASSFIRNGPVRFLENEYGEEWILVLDRAELGISATGTNETLDVTAFASAILPAVQKRLVAKPTWSKFDPTNSGHAILFMTGLCQEFGALTIGEIRTYLSSFGIPTDRLANYAYCAELLGWIKKVRRGNNNFYVATPGEAALDYKFETGPQDKLRWRAEIRQYWQRNDTTRFKAIGSVLVPPGVS
ncbi:retron St85 family effector protein [Reyranella sp.]|uniref:retron St85 family effector protein n=1 Tax=Reyranella sp. TaxID=1929291 RepID=UPI003D0C3F78